MTKETAEGHGGGIMLHHVCAISRDNISAVYVNVRLQDEEEEEPPTAALLGVHTFHGPPRVWSKGIP